MQCRSGLKNCSTNTIKDGDIAPWKDLQKDWTKIKEMNKEITIFWYGEDHQALAFSLRQPSRLQRSGRAYVEYVADMKVADTLWTSIDSLLISTDSLLTSTDSLLLLLALYQLLLTLYWLPLTLYWLLLTSTDSLLTSTDPLLTSTDPLLTAKFSLGHLNTA